MDKFYREIFNPNPNEVEVPDTPAEMFPFAGWAKHGFETSERINEMLSMGYLMEAGRLIVGETFFLEPADTVELPGRVPKDPHESN